MTIHRPTTDAASAENINALLKQATNESRILAAEIARDAEVLAERARKLAGLTTLPSGVLTGLASVAAIKDVATAIQTDLARTVPRAYKEHGIPHPSERRAA